MPIDANGAWYPDWDDSPEHVTTTGHLRHGDGVPSNDLGDNGDAYINDSTGDFYIKDDDVWVILQGAAGGSGESGVGSPEGIVSAPVGTTYVETSAHELWIKESGGSGNTGWTQYI